MTGSSVTEWSHSAHQLTCRSIYSHTRPLAKKEWLIQGNDELNWDEIKMLVGVCLCVCKLAVPMSGMDMGHKVASEWPTLTDSCRGHIAPR